MIRRASENPLQSFLDQGLPRRTTFETLWQALKVASRSHQGHLPPLDKWLEQSFRASRSFGSRDRRNIRDAFFHVFRYLEPIVEASGLRPSDAKEPILAKALTMDWSALCDGWDNLRSRGLACADLMRSASVPREHQHRLMERRQRSGWTQQQTDDFLLGLMEPASLWIRCNPFKITAAELASGLTAQGVDILEVRDQALKVASGDSLYKTPSFTSGYFEIQDLASQAIGEACLKAMLSEGGVQRDGLIWDVCAGAGGKTLQLACAMGGRGAVYATDIRPKALEECKRRAARAGVHNIRTKVWDGVEAPSLPAAAAHQQGFDVVLVDAPCTSSGTWRRNPEARYRLNEKWIQDLTQTQLNLLQIASTRVKPHGHLIYGTCSWLTAENEDVIERFLDSPLGRDFELKDSFLAGLPDEDADAMHGAVLVRRV
jgi:16S rRNA C967 or C1407 C5-methylase (RsmB/RsmF family)